MSRNTYSGISTLNHWITAILVIIMLVLGFMAAGAPSEETEGYIMGIHVGLGFFVFLFVLWRTAYRLYEGFLVNSAEAGWQYWLAYWVHRLILLMLVIQVFTGPLYLFTEGHDWNVFGWFSIAIPLESLAAIHEAMEVIHVVQGLYLLPIVLLLHVAGASWHFLRHRQRTVADMGSVND
ncbi:cytochrome b [Gilvimarinus sp. F26214L]|uniref:cytochrome b n=1 Tax=Gilvimarinus sp. DZF01 TaxID=3461371 RepID=UPI0040462342